MEKLFFINNLTTACPTLKLFLDNLQQHAYINFSKEVLIILSTKHDNFWLVCSNPLTMIYLCMYLYFLQSVSFIIDVIQLSMFNQCNLPIQINKSILRLFDYYAIEFNSTSSSFHVRRIQIFHMEFKLQRYTQFSLYNFRWQFKWNHTNTWNVRKTF